MDPFSTSLARSPELYPQAWDPASDIVRLIRLTEAEYARASFLDDRILSPRTLGRTGQWDELREAVAAGGLVEDCSLIFHIGHVGSTLLSRLLGKHPDVFALREPAILRTLAQTVEADRNVQVRQAIHSRLDVLLPLWSRTFRSNQRSCIKATSFVSELAGEILTRPSGSKAIFMFVLADTYLATILGAENSPVEAAALADSRLGRLHRRLDRERWRVTDLSEGEMTAMSWACEMTALSAAAETALDRVHWLNFDSFLQSPAASLRASFEHLGHETTREQLGQIISGPEMRRYSKAPEHAYDADLRRTVLDHARTNYAPEISRGLAWLEAAAVEFPLIQSVMSRR